MEQSNSFEYTYSPRENDEIRKIRQKYLPSQEDKMEQLRRLDQSATRKGTAVSLIVGILGALVMGTGMSMCMVWTSTLMIPGVIVGVAGMAGVAAAYPLFNHITRKERQRIAPEILRLTDELMK